MRVLIICTLWFSMVFPLRRVVAADQNVDQLLSAAVQASEDQKWQEVVTLMDKAIAIDPKSASAYRERGWAKSWLRNMEEGAFADLDRSAAIDPKSNANNHMRALVKINRRHDYEGAIVDLTRGMTLDPQDWRNYNVRGFCKTMLKRDAEAAPDFDRAIQLNPLAGDPHQHRAEFLYGLGKYEQALVDFEQGITLEKQPYSRQYYTTGECYYQLKNYRKAIERFKQSFRGDEEDAGTYLYIGNCRFALRDYTAALENYDASLKVSSSSGVTHFSRGLALRELGRLKDAEAAFAKAKELGYKGE